MVPRNGDEVGGVCDVKSPVVEVLALSQGVGELAVVDPDVGCSVLDGDKVGGGLRLGDLKVAEDDVLDRLHPEATVGETVGVAAVGTKEGL